MLVLGKYEGHVKEDEGTSFGMQFFNRIQKYSEGLEYGRYLERRFTGGEGTLKLFDERLQDDVWKDPANPKLKFTNPDQLKEKVKKHKDVIVVIRGYSIDGKGNLWNGALLKDYAIQLGYQLTDPNGEFHAENVYLVMPNMATQKQDKRYYKNKRSGLTTGPEPDSINITRAQLKQFYKKVLSVLDHDFRGRNGWVHVKHPKNEPWKAMVNWEEAIKEGRYKPDDIVDLCDWTDFAYSIDGTPLVIDYLQALSGQFRPGEIVIINPDMTEMVGVESLALNGLRIEGRRIESHRDLIDSAEKTQSEVDLGELRGRVAVIVDDRIHTGGTAIEAVNRTIDAGAKEARVVAMHGEFHRNPRYNNERANIILLGMRARNDEPVKVRVSNTVESESCDRRFDVIPILAEKAYEIFR